MSRMDQFHFEHPSYGSRRLARQFDLSRYEAKKMMQLLHLEATYPKPKNSIPHEEHKKYPYLLRHIKSLHSNHIWSTDITYLPWLMDLCIWLR
jgi:putative transposase